MKAPLKSIFFISLLTVLALPLQASLARAGDEADPAVDTHAGSGVSGEADEDWRKQAPYDPAATKTIREQRGPGQLELEDAVANKTKQWLYEAGWADRRMLMKAKYIDKKFIAKSWEISKDIKNYIAQKVAERNATNKANFDAQFPPLGPLHHEVLAKACVGMEGFRELRKIDQDLSAADQALKDSVAALQDYHKNGCPVKFSNKSGDRATAVNLYQTAKANIMKWEAASKSTADFGPDLVSAITAINRSGTFNSSVKNMIPSADACVAAIQHRVDVRQKMKEDVIGMLTCVDGAEEAKIMQRGEYDVMVWMWGTEEAAKKAVGLEK